MRYKNKYLSNAFNLRTQLSLQKRVSIILFLLIDNFGLQREKGNPQMVQAEESLAVNCPFRRIKFYLSSLFVPYKYYTKKHLLSEHTYPHIPTQPPRRVCWNVPNTIP